MKVDRKGANTRLVHETYGMAFGVFLSVSACGKKMEKGMLFRNKGNVTCLECLKAIQAHRAHLQKGSK